MQPTDLLQSARVLLTANRGRPTAVSVRRATSSIYYALFHCLARECANLLIGGNATARSDDAWRQVYRSLEHGQAKDRCRDQAMLTRFPKAVEDFASAFVTMQEKRHHADYDPSGSFYKSEVEADLRLAEDVIAGLTTIAAKHRRAFCAYVLLKRRP